MHDAEYSKHENTRKKISNTIISSDPNLSPKRQEQLTETVLQDLILLARCANSKCLVTYTQAIEMRGHGNRQNGQWLDDVHQFAILPFGLPDLTMLVVNADTKEPSPRAFNEQRLHQKRVAIQDIKSEQYRCFWYTGYQDLLGIIENIPHKNQLVRMLKPEPDKEREIARAVDNALARIAGAGVEKTKIGKEYAHSLPRNELMILVVDLWKKQAGKCALTGQLFDYRKTEQGGIQDDRVSLDRIDNAIGYAAGNIQLVTQFANRARGTLSPEEARRRLVQFDCQQ